MHYVHQKLTGAFRYNVLAIPVATEVLCPLPGLLVSPLIASPAMAFNSIIIHECQPADHLRPAW
jgi:Cu+-exporting ATPase